MLLAISNVEDLIDAGQFPEASEKVRLLIAKHPEDAYLWMLLAIASSELDEEAEAMAAAEKAVQLEPDNPHVRRVFGTVLFRVGAYKRALEEAECSLRLDYDNVETYVLKARVLAALHRRDKAIEALDGALVLDPHHEGAQRLRAVLLEQTGRTAEAEEAFLRVLQADAGDAFGHAGKGWIGLRSGDPNSIHHFQEALRLDPTLEWAREGLIQSLKARNPVFRILLRWFLWLSAQSRQKQRVIIFGGIIGFSALRNISRTRPELAPFIWPILAAYVMFVVASWIGDPLFDTILRFDKEGRAILTPDRIRASNWLVAGITAAAGAAIAAGVGVHEHMIFVAIALGFLLVPIAATFQVEPGRGRTFMALLTTGIAITAITTLLVPESTAVTLLVVSVLLSALSTWISRWLSSRTL
jgi:tetratricopeptide (TPR) repeat protein